MALSEAVPGEHSDNDAADRETREAGYASMEDVQYQESHHIIRVPVKTGDGLGNNEAELERPTSAGTVYSSVIDFGEDIDEEAILAENAITRRDEAGDQQSRSVGQPSRPTSPDALHSPSFTVNNQVQSQARGIETAETDEAQPPRSRATASMHPGPGVFIESGQTPKQPHLNIGLGKHADRPLSGSARRRNRKHARFIPPFKVTRDDRFLVPRHQRNNGTAAQHSVKLNTVAGPSVTRAATTLSQRPDACATRPTQATSPQDHAEQLEQQVSRQVEDGFSLATPDSPLMKEIHNARVADAKETTIPPEEDRPEQTSPCLSSGQQSLLPVNIRQRCERQMPAVLDAQNQFATKPVGSNLGPPQSPSMREQQHQPDMMTFVRDFKDQILTEGHQRVVQLNAFTKIAQQEKQQAANEKQRGEQRLVSALQKNAELQNRIVKDQETVRKVYRMRLFVDTLSNDFTRFSEAEQQRQSRIEDLTQTCASGEQQREELRETVSKALQQTDALKKQAINLRRELQAEHVKATAEIERLSTQLSDKASMLDSERCRREGLEKLLSEATKNQAEVLGKIRENGSAILDKISLIHVGLEGLSEDKTIRELITEMSSAVDGIQKGTTDTQGGMTSVKGLIEAFAEKLNEHIKSNTANPEDAHSSAVTPLQMHFDDSLTKLKQDLVNGEEMLKTNAESRETIAALREQLSTSATRSNDLESRLSTAQQATQHVQQQNDALQSKLSLLQTGISQVDEGQVHLEQARNELIASKGEAKEASAQLASKCEELRILNETHTQLKSELEALQLRLVECQTQVAGFDREREELTNKAEHAERSIRKEMQEHLDQVEVHMSAEAKNDLKKVSSERNRLQERLSTLQEDLKNAKEQLHEHQQHASQHVLTAQELQKSRINAKSHLQEIERLKASLTNLRKAESSAKEEATALTQRLEAERSKGQTAVSENSKLSEKIDSLNRTLNDVKLLEAKYQRESSDKETLINALEEQLTEAKEKIKHVEAGLQLCKASSEKVLQDTIDKGARNIQDLQKSLHERQKEVEQVKGESERFRADVERSWHKERGERDETLTKMQQKLAEAERERDNALATLKEAQAKLKTATETENNKLQSQIDEMRQRAEAAEARLKDTQSTLDTCGAHQPDTASGNKSPGLTKSRAPMGALKAVDHSRDLRGEVDAIPEQSSQVVQNTLIEDHVAMSRSARSSLSPGIADSLRIRAGSVLQHSPFVEETQYQDRLMMPRSARLALSPDIADILRIRESDMIQPASVVEETQSQDEPLIAHRTTSVLTQGSPRMEGGLSQSQYSTARSSQGGPDFSIYEDSQDRDGPLSTQTLQDYGKLEDTIQWSQAERDMYTFQKPVANPNSASKRVHPPDSGMNAPRRSVSQSGRNDRYRPETPRALQDLPGKTLSRIDSNTSSSPGFMRDSQTSGRKMSTYQSHGDSGNKRWSSRNDSNITADPRLASRNMPAPSQKRRSSDQTVDGSRRASKKRSAVGLLSNGAFSQSQNYTSSQTLLPSSSTAPCSASLYEASAPRRSSHMRTLAGTNTRTTRSPKVLKNDEVNARFSQELYRH